MKSENPSSLGSVLIRVMGASPKLNSTKKIHERGTRATKRADAAAVDANLTFATRQTRNHRNKLGRFHGLADMVLETGHDRIHTVLRAGIRR